MYVYIDTVQTQINRPPQILHLRQSPACTHLSLFLSIQIPTVTGVVEFVSAVVNFDFDSGIGR